MSKGLFITGTGTDIGKTYISALMVKALYEFGHNVAYYKAAMSGNDRREDGTLIPGDALLVKETSGITQPLELMCPYVYEHAYSPHLASRLEGNPVQIDVVKAVFQQVCEQYEYITMEGSGGILCPLEVGETTIWLEDIIKELNLGCLIIADAGLGTINHAVLTVEYLRSRDIPVKGIILNHYEADNILHKDNKWMCEKRTGIPVIACVETNATKIELEESQLLSLYDEVK